MNNEEREMIERVLILAEKNNKMLKKISSGIFWNGIWRLFYWAFIVAVGIWLYYQLEPFIKEFIEMYEKLQISPF